MMRLAEIEAHIGSMGELLDIVGAMRSLAGMRRQEALHALPGVKRYAGTMAGAIGDALLLAPEPRVPPHASRARKALVLSLAEHGFVGGFNERLIDLARAQIKPGDSLLAIGSRGAAQAAEHGLSPDWVTPAATRGAGAPEATRRVTTELYRRLARGEVDRVEMIYARHGASGPPTLEHRQLLPVDLDALRAERARQPPLHNLAPAALLETLVAEYVFALLAEAAVESIASENATRFAQMESAHDNIGKKLAQLRQAARLARQDEITTELLDLVTGAEAIEALP